MNPSATETEMIAHVTGGRKGCECSCKQCQQACLRAPCLGTPHDILQLVQHGHRDMLKPTSWMVVPGLEIDMVQINAGEGDPLEDRACPFFKAGRCSIHAIKPTEGVLAHHGATEFRRSPTLGVALTWILPENQKLVRQLFRVVEGRRG